MLFKQKYTYIHEDKFFFIMPVMGGINISTDNTCKTYNQISIFFREASTELNMLKIAIERGEIEVSNDIYSEINIYHEMVELCKQKFGIHNGFGSFLPAYNTPEFESLLDDFYCGVFEFSSKYDIYLKSSNPDFSLPHAKDSSRSRERSDLGELFRNSLKWQAAPELNLPDYYEFEKKVKSANFEFPEDISSFEEKLLSFYKNIFVNELNYPSWELVEWNIKDDIKVRKKYDSFEANDHTKNILVENLKDKWSDIFKEEFNKLSLFYQVIIRNDLKYDIRADIMSYLIQFFLGLCNIYQKENHGYKKDIGKYLNSNCSTTGNNLIDKIILGLKQKEDIEDIIFTFLKDNLSTGEFDEKARASIKKDFRNYWDCIKEDADKTGADSLRYDEFFFLPKSTKSKVFSYNGSMSCEFSHFVAKCLKKDKGTYGCMSKYKDFFEGKIQSFANIPKNDDNSLGLNTIKPFFYVLGNEEDLDRDIETFLEKKEIPYYLTLSREKVIPAFLSLNMKKQNELEQSNRLYNIATDEYKIKNLKTVTDIKTYITEIYNIKYIDKSKVDVSKLSEYPEAIQRRYFQDIKSKPKDFQKQYIQKGIEGRINLKLCGVDLDHLLDLGYTPHDLLYSGFSAIELREHGVSFYDVFQAGFPDFFHFIYYKSKKYPMSNNSLNLGYDIMRKFRNGLENVEKNPQYYNFKCFAELNLTAANLKDLGYSLFELWSEGYSQDGILKAGYPEKMANTLFTSFVDRDATKADVLHSLVKKGISLSDFKDANFSAKDIVEILRVHDIVKLKKAGYNSKDINEAGFSPFYQKISKFVSLFQASSEILRVDGVAIPVDSRESATPTMRSGNADITKGSKNLKKDNANI